MKFLKYLWLFFQSVILTILIVILVPIALVIAMFGLPLVGLAMLCVYIAYILEQRAELREHKTREA